MERFIANVLAFPSAKDLSEADYQRELRALFEFLCKIQAQVLVGNRDSDPLEILDNKANSLGVLFALLARLNIERAEIATLWPKLVEFLSEFDGRQVKIARDQVLSLVRLLVQFCEAANKPILAIKPLQHCISQVNYPLGPKFFTWLHPKFLKMCLDSKCFRAALPILEVDIEEFPAPKEKEVTYRDHLLYHLYGAMVYMTRKQWKRASELLMFVITCPGSHISQIQVDAFRKWILVTLLLEGRAFHFPRTINSNALRSFRTVSKPYDAFATAYMSGNADILRRETKLVADIFQADGNWGLAEQCLENFRRLSIVALTHTYSTLSVETIAGRDLNVLDANGNHSSHADMEQYILDMIERKEIKATLSHLPSLGPSSQGGQNSCMVSFQDLPSLETDILENLENQIVKTINITNQARQLDKKLGLTKDWIIYTSKKKRGSAAEPSSQQDPGFDDMEEFGIRGSGLGQLVDMSQFQEHSEQGYGGEYSGYDPADDEMRTEYDD